VYEQNKVVQIFEALKSSLPHIRQAQLAVELGDFKNVSLDHVNLPRARSSPLFLSIESKAVVSYDHCSTVHYLPSFVSHAGFGRLSCRVNYL
jgi:hypothetical protein